jgi:acetoin utilization deacetylase AcuC-like enzyme
MAEEVHVFWHDACLRHDTGAGVFDGGPSALISVPELHPENAERLLNMRGALARGPLADALRWRTAEPAPADELASWHDPAYVEEVHGLSERAGALGQAVHVLGQTYVSGTTWVAACAAAGAARAAADAVLGGETRVAYALIRPPGHHAGPGTTDGYCFFNNSALAAQRARDRGAARVAIVDWDVHHGNGTQSGFYTRADVLTISLHMDHRAWGRNHEENGTPDEVGDGEGAGFNVNVALPYGVGDRGYAAAFDEVVLPALSAFAPDLIVGACGQDASQFDPNGRQCLTMAGFRVIGERLAAAADECCEGRLVLCQEGGYGRTYSALCVLETLAGILGRETGLRDPLAFLPDEEEAHRGAIEATRAALAPYGTLGGGL